MPRLSIDFPHSLGQEEASRRLKDKLDQVQTAYHDRVTELQAGWNGDTYSYGFKILGMKIAGTVTVAADAVKTTTELPLAAMIFKKPIEERVRQEMGTLLA